MSIDHLGRMNADVVEDIWRSYQVRTALDRIEQDHRQAVMALISNGMVDPKAADELMERLSDDALSARIRVLNPKLEEKDDVSPEGFVNYEWWRPEDADE